MNKYKSILIGLLMIISILLSGCTEDLKTLSDEEKKFIGTWVGNNHMYDIISLFQDGTCSYMLDLSGVWNIKDDQLTITTDIEEVVYFYKLTENNTVLILTNYGTKIPLIYRIQ